MQHLDPLYLSLTGFNLIEASAGTGKTYAITALYVRLVVEAHIPVNRILVVTYTNAATKELRDRVRGRLAQIHRTFLRGRADEEDELGIRLLDLTPDRELAIRRLSNALRGFDEAAIFTIHGFCKRVLGDNAFESGLSFDIELMADTRELLREIVEDFWRRTFYPGSPLVVQYFLDQGISPEILLKQVAPHLGKPYLQVRTPNGDADGAALEQDFVTAFGKARDLWRQDRVAIEALLLTSSALNRQKYNLKSIPGWLVAMDAHLSADPLQLALFDKFEQFTTTRLRASVKKDQTPPYHAFFDACETLKTACEALADYCRYQIPVQLLKYCNAELATRKQRQQVQSYDDLLLNLHDALHDSRRGAALIETLRNRYAAALIDEFQDTDPVQYEIFRRLYVGTAKPVFLVGDPKQAIYSFRGADIFAYLAARRDTTQQHTLEVNWRSDPRLLTALNALFGVVKDQPFLFEGIPFHPAIPAERKQHPLLSVQGRLEPPLRLWLVEPDHSGKPMNKGAASEQAARATAAEIARLLSLGACGQAHIGARPLAGGDITVLVRNHWQGRLIRRQLLQLNVSSVQHADDSVFLSDEARQLTWLLAAIAEPGHEGRVRTALASALFGLRGEALHQLHEQEQVWARWLEKFQDYRQLWQEHGFMRFFRAWLMDEGVPQRLLAFRDGERRLTNVLHLAELLHVASRTHPGMIGLLKWLADNHCLPANQDEEQQLRLESDENLVRIVTVHKSKGLEYEVVFCPFLWDGRLRTGEGNQALYHDPADLRRSILAIGIDDDDPALQLARREEVAESLRLFYVALTRAKQHCTLIWGKIKETDTAPAAWLLHHPPVVGPAQDVLEVTRQRFDRITPSVFFDDLQSVFAPAGETVAMAPLPQEIGHRYHPPTVEEPELQARVFTRPLSGFWRVGSFTALTAGLSAEIPDHDMLAVVPTVDTELVATPCPDIFNFPRGARAGTCLHAIFERLDFSRPDRERLEKLVERALIGHGLDAEAWTLIVADWVERVLATPLDGDQLRLDTVTLDQRLNELEFYYPLAYLCTETLRAVLRRHGYVTGSFGDLIENLVFTPFRGYMKGFIDLVFEAEGRFYLVDYKSNWLGPEPAAYRPDRLTEIMAREAYVLQYLIYTVALHRYLRLRVPDYDYERHFGGVFYLFLRGMDPTRGADCGVFQDRPRPMLIMALDELMRTGTGM
ncbi:MAG: exodeoxyribonuclease V subunit beta [Gammaproteobacteria bacterium]|nr:exodeoxyribonuclease V subunit beta [Gammaproteobacteria bacterium]